MTISSWLDLRRQAVALADAGTRPPPGAGAAPPDADQQALFRQALAAAVQQTASSDPPGRPEPADRLGGLTARDPRFAGAAPAPGAAGGPDVSRAMTGAAGSGGLANVFMRMLIEQIRNQDPLDPMKPEQMVTQLTQMQQVESMTGISALMHGNAAMLESMLVLSMGNAVGTRVAVKTDHLSIDDPHTVIHGSFVQPHASSDTRLALVADDGARREINLGPRAAGEVRFDIDPHRLALPKGRYRIEVQTGDDEGAQAAVEVAGVLRHVRMGPNGTIVLGVAGVGEVGMRDLTNFLGRSTAVARGHHI